MIGAKKKNYVKPLNLPSGQTLVVKMFWKNMLIES